MTTQFDVIDNENSTASVDITNYWQHYNLQQDPFAVGMDPDMYYAIPRWEEYLDLLQYLCHYNNVLLVVTGAVGSGKTTLMRQFITQVSDNMKICHFNAEPSVDTARLIEIFADAFELPWHPEETLEDQLDAQLLQIQQSSQICMVLIDNAHLLPSVTMEALFYLIRSQSDNHMRLHIALFGESSLQHILAAMTAHHDAELIHALSLEPLSLEETRHFVLHRLAMAGWPKSEPVGDDLIARIYRFSDGIPGRINRIARRSMVDMITNQNSSQGVYFFQQHRTKLFGALLLGVLIIVFAMIIKSMSHRNNAKAAAPFPTIAQESKQGEMVSISIPINQPNQAEMQQQAQTQPIQDQKMAQQMASSQAPAPMNVAQANNTIPLPEIKNAPKENTEIVIQEEGKEDTKVTIQEEKLPKSLIPEEPKASTQEKNKEKPKAKAKAQEKSSPAKKEQAKNEKSVLASSDHEKKLLATNGSHYALQLVGVGNLKALNQFIAKNHLEGKALYYHSKLKNKDWYVLVYGNYSSMNEAKKAIMDLPAAVQKLKPYPRSFTSIKESIHHNG